jgi:5-methylcytosine-specific restriction endonuclease McrA
MRRRKRFSSATRRLVFDKTDGRCWTCRRSLDIHSSWIVDHIVPWSKGGTDDLQNLAPQCPTLFIAEGRSHMGDRPWR